jgi:hypothetical protein
MLTDADTRAVPKPLVLAQPRVGGSISNEIDDPRGLHARWLSLDRQPTRIDNAQAPRQSMKFVVFGPNLTPEDYNVGRT